MTISKSAILAALDTDRCFVVSAGTLHPYDIFCALEGVMEALAPAEHQQMFTVCGMTPAYLQAVDEGRGSDYWGTEEALFVIEDMTGVVEAHAPEGSYFGVHEGDGACFGFWGPPRRVAAVGA